MFQMFVAWTFLFAVVGAFALLVLMKVSSPLLPPSFLPLLPPFPIFSFPLSLPPFVLLPSSPLSHAHHFASRSRQVLAPYFLASKHDHSLGDDLADNRCKCVCPHNLNVTINLNTTVWLKEVQDPSEWCVHLFVCLADCLLTCCCKDFCSVQGILFE